MPSVAPVRKNGSLEHRRQEVRQAVKNACDQLNSDGVNARDYVEQLAWLFFLKAFGETESRLEEEAAFEGETYKRRLRGEFRWTAWASLTDKPDEMLKFVNGPLWDKLTATGKEGIGDDAVGDRFRRIFTSVRNHSRRGAAFARTVEQVNRLHFSDESDVIVLSELYENLLKQVAADSAGYAGEFYTQRHIIGAMVEVVKPGKHDRIYDPCFGTAGFLGEAAEYIRGNSGKLSDSDLRRLQNDTFFGIELKPLTYLLGTMNMLLHRIEGARLEMANTLELHTANAPEKNKYSVILSNPPYGGQMSRELQTNFTIQSGSTEILFLQHIMANLAKGGRAAVIIPEGVLFRGGPDAKVRKKLIEEFNVHTVLSLPAGCFLPYTGVKTNVLFFDRSANGNTTSSVWYYELTNDGFELKQTRRPIAGEQVTDFVNKYAARPDGDNSWSVGIEQIVTREYALTAKNPYRKDDPESKGALQLVQSIRSKEDRIMALLDDLQGMLEGSE